MSEKEWKEQQKREKKEKLKQLKGLSFKQKAAYIWDYYRFWIIGTIIVVAIGGNLIYTMLKPKPVYSMNLVMVNSNMYQVEETTVFTDFEEAAGFSDPINVNSNIQLNVEMTSQTDAANYQLLSVMFMTKELDLLLADKPVFDKVGASGGFYEISDVLSEELIEKYEDRLITTTNEESKETFICGIRLSEDCILVEEQIYMEAPIAGVMYGSENKEEATKLLLYLLGEPYEDS